ncbi:cytoplasmic tRNA 2-thiolation protein 2 [Impatiens glandulifera]|uniref:cytoplasmic tRNA 2-thiolation protein 2 n=1 Tax=Impatiens glandulifera TaxID=253017 RepID=UPI001FB0E82B|nr:cytoplasmic tRNA 2-thiolation protein 2 [Impatiens glandulifera]
MACRTGGECQSGCYKEEEENGTNEAVKVVSSRDDDDDVNRNKIDKHLCIKCKCNQPISITNPTAAAAAAFSDASRFCIDCFRNNLFGKFRFAITSNAMISPSDKVLVAFSGGPSSRVAIEFVREIQHKAQKNFDASRDRSLAVFGIGVAFINESDAHTETSHELDEAIEEMKLIVSNLDPPKKNFHVASLGSLWSSDSKYRLKELVNAVNDVTGREDLLLQLRMLSLQKIALENGYNKLLLGSCTSRLACHVLTATVKGKGYSLAADIQYVDARWEVPVLLPLRDCLTQELNLLCCLDSLKTVEVFERKPSGINGLVTSFVKLLQEENPSRESTIVRTAGKLIPFQFNMIPDSDDCNGILSSERRQKKYNQKFDESLPPDSFCAICNSPLDKSDNDLADSKTIEGMCCFSCQFEILPQDTSSMEQFYSLLPNPIAAKTKHGGYDNQRWLREQIQDCLLSDDENGV